MKIREIFGDIFKGFDLEKEGKYENFKAYLIDAKDVENCQIRYGEEKEINVKYREKYFLKDGDVIVSTRPSATSCHVGYYSKYSIDSEDKKVIPKKNFIVLRDCNKDLFVSEFIANYLEYIGIKKFFEGKSKDASITKFDIEELEIPNVPLEKQQSLVRLFYPVNERSALYKRMIENDERILKFALEKEIKDVK